MKQTKNDEKLAVQPIKRAVSKVNYKLSDDEFFDVLRQNAGILARTGRAIEKKYGIKFSRQAVEDRAKRHPELLNEIRAAAIDDAEEILMTLMRTGSEKVRCDIVKFYLRTQGKERGYTEKIEQNNNSEIIHSVIVKHVSTGVPFASTEKEINQGIM